MRGSLRKRGNNWQLLWSTRGADGKRKQHCLTVRGTKREAERKMNEIIRSVDQNTYVEPSKETVGEFLADWLVKSRSLVGVTSQERYERIVRSRLIPEFGGTRLTALKTMDIQAVYARWSEEGLSASTIRLMHAVLRRALESACKWEKLQRNPAAYVDLPASAAAERAVLGDDDMKRILSEAEGHPHFIAILLAITTGMRRGELCGLQWEDIDFDGKRLSVVRTAVRTEAGVVLKEPKTDQSRRVIYLDDMTVELLLPWRGKGLVLRRRNGGPLSPDVLSHSVRDYLSKLDIRMTMHGLRHSHASLLLRGNVHPKAVSERLGHAKVGFTLATYSHLLPDQQRDAAAYVAEALVAKPLPATPDNVAGQAPTSGTGTSTTGEPVNNAQA